MIKNISDEFVDNFPNLPAGYNYYWYFDGEKLSIMENGKKIDYNILDSGYRSLVPNLRYYNADELENISVLVAVKDTLVENVYANSPYYREQLVLPIVGTITIILVLISLFLIIYTLLKRPEKRAFDRKLAAWSGKIWIEVKGLVSLFAFFMPLVVIGSSSYRSYMGILDGLTNGVIFSFFVLLSFWWFYLMLMDLLINRRRFFTHNSINSLLTWYRKFEKRYPWQQLMLKRAYLLVAAELILAFLSVMFVFIFFPIGLIIAGLGLYLIYRYLKEYEQTLEDFGKLIDHIELLKDGNMESPLKLPPDSTIYPAAQNLNTIQEGISIAVAEKIKSERMKIDLITNVSHDLKTPLTSIISYVDLLTKEENLPEHVTDYINILAQKSDRLKHLIQDLFDLSKASSENIALDLEKLDLGRLIQQTLGDMEEAINESGLTLKLNIPDDPVYILSDGDKLYRVWENLISNALKYY
ncbi:MAG: hypothetical protein GX790_06200 [Syntrophomonadaceae bacterium]|nr:hypothetical protein [Syntrophomonadaceae bacterium]